MALCSDASMWIEASGVGLRVSTGLDGFRVRDLGLKG